jgi:hypothetical protein
MSRLQRQMIKRQRHLCAVEVDLEHTIDRLPDHGELVERRLEQAPLHVTADNRDSG